MRRVQGGRQLDSDFDRPWDGNRARGHRVARQSPGGAGEVVVQGFWGDAGIKPADAKEKPQEFLVFGVDADDRIRRFYELVAIAGNDLKLPILAEMFPQGKGFERFATAQAVAFKKLGHDGHAHLKTKGSKPLGDLSTREIGPEATGLIGVAGGAGIDYFQERLIEARPEGQTAFASAPFFRAW